MKRMESTSDKTIAVESLLARIEQTGMSNAEIARYARLPTATIWHIKTRSAVPRWATIDKINRGLNRWEAKTKE